MTDSAASSPYLELPRRWLILLPLMKREIVLKIVTERGRSVGWRRGARAQGRHASRWIDPQRSSTIGEKPISSLSRDREDKKKI